MLIDTIYKKMYKLVIPSLSQQGEIIKINNLGLYNEELKQFGDMYIKLNILLPQKLNKQQIEIIRKYF